MRRRNQKLWGNSYIRVAEDGTTIHSQRKHIGYGRTYYMVVGSRDGVLAFYDRNKRSYPPQGYGGHYPEPVEIADGLWLGEPEHSESCE